MLIINNRSLKISNSWLNPVSSPEPPPPTPTFDEVTIGTQIWMSSNLDIDDGGDGIYELNDVKWYSLSAAQRIANTISGWHLPTMSEWETLQTYIGGWDAGTSLGSITGWTVLNGTNTTGFNAYPNGIYSLINGTVNEWGMEADWWASDSSSGFRGYQLYSRSDRDYLSFTQVGPNPDYYYCTVRLIKDT